MEYHSGGSLPLLGRPRYCPGANSGGGYLCESGHCCAESGCCTYYYELWWFWLLWTVLILFSCCCAYRHRRAKLRVQQQQRQRDISLLAYQGAASFPSSMIDLSFLASLKLPSYEEVAAQPSTPPPPYSSVFTAPRYPQPPRSAHPHLLSGHPLGASQHPGPRCPLSDGPSSLSSDNSSSCSCDSCCPSSPCSSSLSAPVTYETDTSHASTPSEAPPLALDPVAIETISAAAARLGSKDPASAVAILIERTDPATESVVAAGSALPSDPDASIPVGRALPSKNTDHSGPDARTLENTSFQTPRTLPLILDSVGGNTDTNPSLVPISVSPPNLPRAETQSAKPDTNVPATSPNTSPSQTSPASRTVHTNPSPSQSPKLADCSPQSQGIAHFSLKPAGEPSERAAEVTEQGEGTSRESPSLTELEDTKNPLDVFGRGEQTVELCKSTQVLATSTNRAETTSSQPEVSLETSSELYQNSNSKTTVSSPIFTGLKLTPEPTVFSPEAKFETPTVQELATTQSTESASVTMPEFECPSISSSQNTSVGFQEAVPPISQLCLERPSETTPAKAVASDTDVVSPTLDQEKGLLERSTQEENSASLAPPTVDLEREKLPGIKAVDSEVLDLERPDDTSQSSLENEREELCVLKPADSGRPNSELPGPDSLSKGDSLQTSDQEINLETAQKQSEFLDLERSPNSSFPAITIEADPPSFAGSPCSIPSLPQSPTNATLLLDPLSALQPSDRSAASSGHASSLSPSPRNTQSPPKQTLFSPCVDVFEPVDPSWEDEESEEQNDEEYCEDSDVAADESQYRHRRLTGDSGIEVCRCRMEDEDEEEEEEEREKVKVSVSGEKMAELHDSVDCPGRSRRSSLCNTEASAETVAISVETV